MSSFAIAVGTHYERKAEELELERRCDVFPDGIAPKERDGWQMAKDLTSCNEQAALDRAVHECVSDMSKRERQKLASLLRCFEEYSYPFADHEDIERGECDEKMAKRTKFAYADRVTIAAVLEVMEKGPRREYGPFFLQSPSH